MAEEIIGNYRLLAEIGRGGMGIIYKAEQISLGRIIALKVLYPHLAADPITVKRFTNEARAAALLNCPNIVQIHDVGVGRKTGSAGSGVVFLLMHCWRQRL